MPQRLRPLGNKGQSRINFPKSNFVIPAQVRHSRAGSSFPRRFVIPAQAGTQNCSNNWFPAWAGMTRIVALTEFVELFRPRSQVELLDVDNHAGDIVFRAAVESRLDHRLGTLLRFVVRGENGLNLGIADSVGNAV